MSVHVLRSVEDIRALKRRVRPFDRPAAFRVELHCPAELAPGRRRRLERRLAFALSDCGCAAAGLALLLVPLYLYLLHDYPAWPFWPNTGVYLLLALAACAAAKLASLALSYRLASRSLDELLRAAAAADPHCGPVAPGRAGPAPHTETNPGRT